MKRIVVLVCAMLCVSVAFSLAHERREVGPYTVVVGFRDEPAFEDESNAFDFRVTRTADQKPISVRDGDIVDLEVQVQLRASDAFGPRSPRRPP